MRALRRLPDLAAALRAGRLCLTTLALLDPVLTAENAEALVVRAAYRSKAEVEALVAALRPRAAPRDGVRRAPDRRDAQAPALATAARSAVLEAAPAPSAGPSEHGAASGLEPGVDALAPWPTQPVGEGGAVSGPGDVAPAPAPRPSVRPVAEDTWSLRVTVDAAFKQELGRLAELLSHRVPAGDLAAVLREAVACAIEKHGKRKGAVEPARKRSAKPPEATAPDATAASQRREHIPAELRRQVWARDGGRCTWVGPDGHRCESRWQLEADHVVAVALGGRTDLASLRLTCKGHNRLHAERTFGRAFMDRFRSAAPRAGARTSPGRSGDGAGEPA